MIYSPPRSPQLLMHEPRMHPRATCRVYKNLPAHTHAARHDQELLSSLITSIYKPKQPKVHVNNARAAINSGVTSPPAIISNSSAASRDTANEFDVVTTTRSVTSLSAGRDIVLGTVTTESSDALKFAGRRYSGTFNIAQSQDIGTQIIGSGDVSLSAKQDIQMRAADIQAGNQLSLSAVRNITIAEGQSSFAYGESHNTLSPEFIAINILSGIQKF